MGRGTLPEVRDGLGTRSEVWDGSGDTPKGPERVGGPFGRFGTGRVTLPKVWDGSEDHLVCRG